MKLARRRLPLLVLLVVIATACPKSSDLDKAAKASNELAHDVIVTEKTIAALFNAGKLNLAQKDAAAVSLKLVAVNGKRFNAVLIELDRKYPQGTLPPQDVEFIKREWQTVSKPFFELFGQLDLLGLATAVKDLNEDVRVIDRVMSKENIK